MNRILKTLSLITVLSITLLSCSKETVAVKQGETNMFFKGKKAAIIYFSVSNNTKKFAETIQKLTGGDLIRLEPVVAYNSNPNGCRAALNVLSLFDACRILVTPGMVELGAKQEELNFEFGQEAAKACDYIVLVGKNQTVPIYNGVKDAGYNMDNVYVADNLNDALAKVQAYQTSKKKVVLLENDLPDNY